MNIERDRVVRFHYDLSDESGNRIESTRTRDPHAILYGHGNVIAGVERALAGHAAGDTIEVTVSPEDAYGSTLR